MTRTENYMGTFAPNVSADNSELYAELLTRVQRSNVLMRGTGRKLVLRKRYRGPRPTTRCKSQRQSMCLKRDATRCDVYLYTERCE